MFCLFLRLGLLCNPSWQKRMCIVALVGLELVSTLLHCFRLPSAGVTGMITSHPTGKLFFKKKKNTKPKQQQQKSKPMNLLSSCVVCAFVHVCAGAHVEVRGLPVGVGFLLTPWESWGWNSEGQRVIGHCLRLLSCVPGPSDAFDSVSKGSEGQKPVP